MRGNQAVHPTDTSFTWPARIVITDEMRSLKLHHALAFVISPDRIDEAHALCVAQHLDVVCWMNGFVRLDSGRRDYQTLLMVRGGKALLGHTLATLPITGYVIVFGNGSYKVFKTGVPDPIEIGNPFTRDELELAYTKLTGVPRRFALSHAYRDLGGGALVRNTMRRLGYL
jgi:hypothetical protein